MASDVLYTPPFWWHHVETTADAPALLGVEPLGVFASAEAVSGAGSDPASDDEAAPDLVSESEESACEYFESGDSDSDDEPEIVNGRPPDFFPEGWDFELVQKHNLSSHILSESLRINEFPNNWKIITNELDFFT